MPSSCTHNTYHSHTQLINIIKWYKRTCKLHHTLPHTHQMCTLSYLAKHINIWVKHVHLTHTFPVNLEGFIQERESGLRLSKTRPVIRSRFRICVVVRVCGGRGWERERERERERGRERVRARWSIARLPEWVPTHRKESPTFWYGVGGNKSYPAVVTLCITQSCACEDHSLWSPTITKTLSSRGKQWSHRYAGVKQEGWQTKTHS